MSSFLVFLLHQFLVLPAGLDHAGHFARQRQIAEADAAQLKFADKSTRPSAAEATVPVAAGKLRLFRRFRYGQLVISCYLCGGRHRNSLICSLTY
jgi:hypothetical protein